MCGLDKSCGCGCEKQAFGDRDAVYDPDTRTVVSMRDGVYEYLGYELGVQPFHKFFKVYRSPETVIELSKLLQGIPATNDHVSVESVPGPEKTVGQIKTTEIQYVDDPATDSTLQIKNELAGQDCMIELLANGKRELSLGFKAKVIPHEKYDFEQVGIEPHHLAVLKRGRCGSACTFIDRQPNEVDIVKKIKVPKHLLVAAKPFMDAEGMVTLAQLMDLIKGLPAIISALPAEKLGEVAEMLSGIAEMAKELVPEADPVEPAPEADPAEPAPEADPVEPTPEGEPKPTEDADPEADPDKDPIKDEDPTDEDKLAMADGKILFSDAQVQAVMQKAIAEHSTVVEKARGFLDHKYNFEGKTTDQIRQDVLTKHLGKPFADTAKLAVAFEVLQPSKTGEYKDFGDSGLSVQLQKIAKKELT